ncbi:MAG: DNA primase [Arthrobacter sp.]|uniref:DNA primase n=1 Tax=unclassified Arthrobacter TaxID=235627 RepID=UPI00264D5286|nr:DNA primase [Micrococcaceae bacterium]MDN5823882.1 DNA primase [Micrococcaceae bacterium]MDN5879674.1 DNA primase [Micrococcaceae bacterium]MDN5887073.1 DNA primase [Micrococcaceae bacterium]MDN5905390.1 DNA primase [Micrococcaceae bacterium]
MAGLIKREDIDEVRSRTDIKEVVDGYVTLRSAGIGSFKGLCPFHDERSPSFHVRPQVGTFHCFGCEESGDVISFIQKMDHTTFSETVEHLAGRIGFELRYEDGGSGPSRQDVGRRQRLLDAHKIAEEYFRSQLLSEEAATGRQYLSERAFDRAACDHFGVGYAPKGWDQLLKHLRSRGFQDEELKLTGMFSEGNRGIYDRFRGRLIWPIRDLTGATIGFGARKLYEDDQGPKYLNTPETQLYKKSQVLYGVDLAKREITKNRQLIVVEGYTDVMACHLSGLGTAVATCGTAFGADHIKIARRLLRDDGSGGEVVFTFDGDAAGQKAALRAFEEDQRFIAQTYVAVEPSGADPCELRQHRGPEAVKELIDSKRPLFEFAIRAGLKKFNLDTVEGRVQALRASAPIVAAIRDSAMRPAYSRELAGWLGMDMDEVNRAVGAAAKRARDGSGSGQDRGSRPGSGSEPRPQGPGYGPGAAQEPQAPAFQRPDVRDPVTRMERESLEVVLQQPGVLSADQWQAFYTARFLAPVHAAVHDAVRAAGAAGATPSQWVESIRQEVPDPLRSFVSELAVNPLPANSEESLTRYCHGIMNRLFDLQITHQKADRLGQLQRMDPVADPEGYQRIQRELMELELRRRSLRQE